MRIIEVQERSSLNIPLSEIVNEGGNLKLRPDLIGKGLIEVKQSNSGLRLQINGLVGRLPVTESLSLDIKPKFSVSNLNRMVYASQATLLNPFFMNRPYESFSSQNYLPVPLIRSFSKSLVELISSGILRKYERVSVEGSPKPRIDFNKTQQKYWSKLMPTMAVMDKFEFSQDNLPNQCIKLAAMKAISISRGSGHLASCIQPLAQSLRQLENVRVRDIHSLRREIASARPTIPAFRTDYGRALDQALELVRNSDVSLNTSSKGLSLESYIISLDDVFEQYIRSAISELPTLGFGRVASVDGNLARHQRPLFSDNAKYLTKPDLIVRDRRGALAIGDVKYKMKASEEDRYQIISHALSHQVQKAVLIYPKPATMLKGGLARLGAIGAVYPIEVFEYFFDLSSSLDAEEVALRQAICELLA